MTLYFCQNSDLFLRTRELTAHSYEATILMSAFPNLWKKKRHCVMVIN